MSQSLTDDEFQAIAAKDHAKIEQTNKKTGYKEGVFDGRQSVFQSGFDTGYATGFRNAFTIGQHQGLTATYNRIENQMRSEPPNTQDLLLAKPTRGQCLLCIDKQLTNENIPQVLAAQTKHFDNVSKALHKKYAPITEFLNDSN